MSDSTTTIAKGELAEAKEAHAETHVAHPPYQRHHFETVAQQFDATNFAMWLFLLTEIMFFGGLFTAYLIMRNWYYPAFVEGSHHLSIFWGTSNTAVLITSSFTMAMGVWCAQTRRKTGLILCLTLTLFLGFVFLCIKGIEWHGEWVDQHVPGLRFTDVDFLNPSMDTEVYKEYHDSPLATDPCNNRWSVFVIMAPAGLTLLAAATRSATQGLFPTVFGLAFLAGGVREVIRFDRARQLAIGFVGDGRIAQPPAPAIARPVMDP